MSIEQILAWADAHHARCGRWPTNLDGAIEGAHGETWMHVDGMLERGRRGLPGGMSLAQLLAKHRSVRIVESRAPLSIERILDWADAHHARTGRWPGVQSGPIPHARGESWYGIQIALKHGRRGLPGGSSIARLLHDQRGVRSKSNLQPLNIRRILTWSDAHHSRTGRWPTRESGIIEGGDGTTWMAVQDALYLGGRGLPGGNSLAQVLQKHRSVRNIHGLADLTVEQVLAWADAHLARTGRWPIRESGEIPDSSGENWGSVDHSLKIGSRGLPPGRSLARLLAAHRQKRNPRELPPLSEPQILAWAESHFRRTGRWPSQATGNVLDAPGEKWRNIDTCLYKGLRGLPGRSSLARVIGGRKPGKRAGRKWSDANDSIEAELKSGVG